MRSALPYASQVSQMRFDGAMQEGLATFAYRVSSYPGSGFFSPFVQGVSQMHVDGEKDWTVASVRIPAGTTSMGFSFSNFSSFPCNQIQPPPPGGANCADRAWADAVVLPLQLSTPTVGLDASLNPTNAGFPVTFESRVTGGGANPTGKVQFRNAGAAIAGCAAVPLESGVARCTVTLPPGAHSITAFYSGNVDYRPLLSPTLSQTVNPPPTPTTARRFDFSGDNEPDLVFRNGAGSTYVWIMAGLALEQDRFLAAIDPAWKLIGHGDFDGNGWNDVVWRHATTGSAYVWYLDNGAMTRDAFLFTVDPRWQVEAVADFDANGKPDFLFQHATSGNGFIWYFNDTTPVRDQFLYSIDNQWIVEAVGDVDDDGHMDFFFRNTASGLGFVWYWTGSALGDSSFLFQIDPVWQVVQVIDWNNDGTGDFVFRNDQTGVMFVWYTDDASLTGSDNLFQVDPAWKVVPCRN